jgi:hypothetical protein
MLEAAEREAKMRASVYPRWIASGKMTEAKADHEVRCMIAIVGVLKALASDDPPELLLESMAKAADQEDAAQRGEPSPWRFQGSDEADDAAFRAERLAAMREAWKAIRAHL